MKFNPPRLKFRRPHSRPIRSNSFDLRKNTTQLLYGHIGIQCMQTGWLTANHIEAVRLLLKRKLNKDDQIFIRVKPVKGITARAKGIRMGKGKGLIEFWVIPVRKGRVLFEIYSKKYQPTLKGNYNLYKILSQAIQKLPLKSKIVFS